MPDAICTRLNIDAAISLVSFLSGIFIFFVYYLLRIFQSDIHTLIISFLVYFLCLYLFFYICINRLSTYAQCDLPGNAYRAIFLGSTCAFGLYLVFILSQSTNHNTIFWPFGLYMLSMSLFHWSEFFITAIYNLPKCSLDIYMLNHSSEYLTAVAFGVSEYWIRIFLLPSIFPAYISTTVQLFGFLMCIAGDCLRKYAMCTAATNFNHHIEYTHRSDHVLVTQGVYAWFRHPAYVGWFYWALGTQVLLGNPFCFFAYFLAVHRYFQSRIHTEEAYLLQFFGEDYRVYQRAVGVGIPFISGYST